MSRNGDCQDWENVKICLKWIDNCNRSIVDNRGCRRCPSVKPNIPLDHPAMSDMQSAQSQRHEISKITSTAVWSFETQVMWKQLNLTVSNVHTPNAFPMNSTRFLLLLPVLCFGIVNALVPPCRHFRFFSRASIPNVHYHYHSEFQILSFKILCASLRWSVQKETNRTHM